MWNGRRVCKVDVLLVLLVSFLSGMIVTYMTIHHAHEGYCLDVCQETMVCTETLPLPVVAGTERPYLMSNDSGEQANLELPTIFAITPTYARYTQRVDLTSLCHTLMHVPDIIWIVIEDSEQKTELVTNLLAKCTSVSSVHLSAKTPPPSPMKPGEKRKDLGKGVVQRNAALSWIRRYCSMEEVKCRGVVYLMDDDNKYDLRLFQEIRKTKKASVFPVAFAGGLKFEGPICFENGTTASWHVSYAPERSIPIDMAGFAINVDLIINNKEVVFGRDKNGDIIRRLETNFLEQFTTRETAECLGRKEVMVWHVQTIAGTKHEKQNPSDPRYIV